MTSARSRKPSSSSRPLLDRAWDVLTRKHVRRQEPWAIAAYLSWAFPLAYGIMRAAMVAQAHPLGPGAVIDTARVAAVIGLPMVVLGMVVAVIAFVRGEPRLWMAVGAFAVCGLIAVICYLEMTGKLVGVLAAHLPGVEESLGG